MKAEINFYGFDTFGFSIDDSIKTWLDLVIQQHGFSYSEINYTVYTDDQLLDINRQYLDHDFYTDIITFDNTIEQTISADIALSYDRIKENAQLHQTDFERELRRVLVHGLLHCMGYADHTPEDKAQMRQEEDKALNMFHVEH